MNVIGSRPAPGMGHSMRGYSSAEPQGQALFEGQPARILIVDDVELTRNVLQEVLQDLGHDTETASDGYEALAKLKLGFDLVLLDIGLPGMDGFEVARRMRADPEAGEIPIIMVTALNSQQDRVRAIEAGANDFISKPVDVTELRVRSTSLLEIKAARDAVRRQQERLEDLVAQRTESLRRALETLVEAQRAAYHAQLETIHRLALAAEIYDPTTAEHILRVSAYCRILARRLNLSPGEVEVITQASTLHDVGKVGVPGEILRKDGELTRDEWVLMKQHTLIGARILSDSPSELLRAGEVIALAHHEKWDGSGYPHGLAAEEIPLSGRICAVADVFDALTSKRPYKEAFSNRKARRMLLEGRGTHFDPRLVDLFLKDADELERIRTHVPAEGARPEPLPEEGNVLLTLAEPLPPPLRRRVLVVAENANAAEMLSALLEMWGYEPRTVSSGREVIRAAVAFQPEVILLDLERGLPGLDGAEVARKIRQRLETREALLVAMMDYEKEPASRDAPEASFDYCLTKPVEPETLRKLLDGVEARAER
jgi:putative two-component system response regulator